MKKKMRNVKQDVQRMIKEKKHLDENFMGKKIHEEEAVKVEKVIKDNLILFDTLEEADKNFVAKLGEKTLMQFMSTFAIIDDIKLVKHFVREIGIRNAIDFGNSYKLVPECYNIYYNPFTIIATLIEELKYGNIYCIGDNLYGTLDSFPIAKYNIYEWGNMKITKKVKKIASISLNENDDIYCVNRKEALKFLVPKVIRF